MASTSLRQVNGLDETPAVLADSTVVLIDYQNTYTTGVMELTGWQAALESAAQLLTRARAAGATIVHVVHNGGPGTPYDLDAEIGQIHSFLTPREGETTVVKTAPNAFVGTHLDEILAAAGGDNVVLAGFMTHMCVQFTTEGAFLDGSKPTVIADACATRPLASVLGEISAEDVHRAALATISDLYGVVVRTVDDLG